MPETIESFVAKLQADGVEAGKTEAAKIVADAQAEADKIIADAKAQADKIVATATTDADNLLARGKTELSLASRDTVLKLQDALNSAMQTLVSDAVKAPMGDTAFLGKLLHEVVLLYIKELQESREVMRIKVAGPLREELTQWALKEIGQATVDGYRGCLDMTSTLASVGFEYTVSGATVEVTPDSVTDVLAEMLSPSLRDLLTQAIADDSAE